jgi:hypothetical protein
MLLRIDKPVKYIKFCTFKLDGDDVIYREIKESSRDNDNRFNTASIQIIGYIRERYQGKLTIETVSKSKCQDIKLRLRNNNISILTSQDI